MVNHKNSVTARWEWFPEASQLEFVNAGLNFDTRAMGLRCDGWRRHRPVASLYRPFVKRAFDGITCSADADAYRTFVTPNYTPEAAAARAGLRSGAALVENFTRPCTLSSFSEKRDCRAFCVQAGECEAADGRMWMRYTVEQPATNGGKACDHSDGVASKVPCRRFKTDDTTTAISLLGIINTSASSAHTVPRLGTPTKHPLNPPAPSPTINAQVGDEEPPPVILWFGAALLARRADTTTPATARARANLLAIADAAMKAPPDHVTNKKLVPPSRDIHDYWSVASYDWPCNVPCNTSLFSDCSRWCMPPTSLKDRKCVKNPKLRPCDKTGLPWISHDGYPRDRDETGLYHRH